jgi:hypothetical protein
VTHAVATGGAMPPEEERAHKRQLAEMYADEAEAAVKVIEAKLAGTREALAAKKAEAKELRAAARKGGE